MHGRDQAVQIFGSDGERGHEVDGAAEGADPDPFVDEQTEIGRLLHADPMPPTASSLAGWIADHPDVEPSPGLTEAVAFLRRPPLPWFARIPYRLMVIAAAATIPPRLRRMLGLRRWPGARLMGRALIGLLRWALGSSPSWHISLVRVGAPVPPGLFRQALPTEGRIDQDGALRGVGV